MSYQPYAGHHITARPKPLIEAVPVDRSGEYGFWYHPGLPDLEEGEDELFRDWLQEQQLELRYTWLEDDDSPEAQAYWEGNDPNLSFWNPQPPAGDGWFLLWLGDTEDGGVAVYARRVTHYPAPDVESDGGEV